MRRRGSLQPAPSERDAPAPAPPPSAAQLAAWTRLWDFLLRPMGAEAAETRPVATPEEIAERNAQKQREAGKEGGRGHRKGTSGEILPEGFDDHPTRNEVGRAIGMSGKTYEKARAIFQAAEEDPERYQGLADHITRGSGRPPASGEERAERPQ